jgi:hypothetical protein
MPQERLYEIGKKLFLVTITVEGFENNGRGDEESPNGGGGNDQDGEEDEENDDADDLDNPQDEMDTDKKGGEILRDKTPYYKHSARRGSKTVVMGVSNADSLKTC